MVTDPNRPDRSPPRKLDRRHGALRRGIPRRTEQGPAPLSFAQERILFLEQMAGGSPLFNCPFALWLTGPLDIGSLERSLGEIETRHQTLRTRFVDQGGELVQVVAPARELVLPVVDMTEVPEAERRQRALQRLAEESRKPFDLATAAPWTVELLHLGEDKHLLYVGVHHTVFDVISIDVLLGEICDLYGAFTSGKPSPLAELPIQYADYAVWERERQCQQGRRQERPLAYWKRKLAEPIATLELPTDRPHPAVQAHRGEFAYASISPEVTAALRQLSLREGMTMFMLLLAAYKVLLSRYSGQQDILVGVPFSNRDRSETQGLIGIFINTLVMRTDLGGDPSFREVAQRVRDTALDAYSNATLPFEVLVETLHPNRDQSRFPLFQVMFDMLAGPRPERLIPGLEPLRFVDPWELHTSTAKTDLHLLAGEDGDRVVTAVEYNTDLFDASTVERLLGHYANLLAGIAADADTPISKLPLLSEVERQQIAGWNNTTAEFPVEQCVHELIEERAARTPDALAVAAADSQFTYADLNQRANRLAHYLRARGVGPDVLVGVLMERTPEMVVALVGVLKAGGAYVPMDPANPVERQALMIADAKMPVLVTQQSLLSSLPDCDAAVLCVDRDAAAIAGESGANPELNTTACDLAYVIFTSGSTGRPKGVQVPHRGLLNLVFWHRDVYKVTPADRATQVAGLAFDASVWELWPYLTAGASVHLPRDEIRAEPARLLQWLADQAITLSFAPTPLAEAMLKEPCPEGMVLRALLTGGDKLRSPPPADLPFALINHYGPTENSVVATCGPVLPEASVERSPPIGRPISNVEVQLLDRNRRQVPVGVPGELHIGGRSLARGYHDQLQLTADAFIPHPFAPGERLYKTGDLARYLPDGNLEFLGRIDHQVKLRGFRIELGEIESILGQHPGVAAGVVVACGADEDQRRLVAYVVPAAGVRPSHGELTDFLQGKLPGYMVPSTFVLLESLPLTANGKVDHRALPAPSDSGPEPVTYVSPKTALEQSIASVWQEVLGLDKVGADDNFFNLGGHSLLMARVCTRLRRLLDREIAMVDLFHHATISSLAAHLGRGEDTDEPGVDAEQTRDLARGRRAATQDLLKLKQKTRAGRTGRQPSGRQQPRPSP